MPTTEHELPLEMVRNRPQLVTELLRSVFGLDVSEHARATLASESYADTSPAELRCDATVLLGDPKSPVLGVVVESQLRPLKQKSYRWPAYLASLRLRRRCPVMLLVLCPDQSTARGCALPIDMGHPGWVLESLTVHPGMLPPITDPDQASRLPEPAVLSAPAHADGPHSEAVLRSVATAIGSLTGDVGALYHDYVLSRFSDAARKLMEDIEGRHAVGAGWPPFRCGSNVGARFGAQGRGCDAGRARWWRPARMRSVFMSWAVTR